MKEKRLGQLYAIQFVKQDKVAICSYDHDFRLFIDDKGKEISVEFIENMVREGKASIKELIDEEQLMDLESHKLIALFII